MGQKIDKIVGSVRSRAQADGDAKHAGYLISQVGGRPSEEEQDLRRTIG